MFGEPRKRSKLELEREEENFALQGKQGKGMFNQCILEGCGEPNSRNFERRRTYDLTGGIGQGEILED